MVEGLQLRKMSFTANREKRHGLQQSQSDCPDRPEVGQTDSRSSLELRTVSEELDIVIPVEAGKYSRTHRETPCLLDVA